MTVTQATVFGATGFVGRYLVKRLAGAGARVIAAARRPERAGFLKPMGDVGQILPVAADIRDRASAAAAVAGSDVVANLVGILHESGGQRFSAVHAQGAENVALAAAGAGAARLIHVSALGAGPAAASRYGRSKAAGEAAVRAAFPAAAIVRPSLAFGPEDEFLNRFAALARFAPALPLIDGGRTRFQPLHVQDLAEALARVARRRGAEGETWELGGPRVYTFRELLELVLAVTGRRAFLAPAPRALLALQARVLELLPRPPLTRDQIAMLSDDSVAGADPGAGRIGDLGIAPAALEAIAPEILAPFRRGAPRRGLTRNGAET